MPRPVSSIPNLGPASEAAFARAGIHSAEEVYALGADEAYLRLLQSGTQPHFIGYYALAMGVQGRPWNDCHGAEKATLRKAFDAIKASAAQSHPMEKGRSEMEAALDLLGLRPSSVKKGGKGEKGGV
ncbi:MAG: TfoX/Sxy family protein [Paracoccaceae bacterium]